MNRRIPRFHAAIVKMRTLFSEELLALLLVLFVFTVPAAASTRFEQRSLFMQSTLPGVTTAYKLSMTYMTPAPVGSVDMLFCVSPIPYEACEAPTGIDTSNALLSNQTGETGFTISSKSANHLVLSRVAGLIAPGGSPSTYTLENIVNPTDTTKSFSIRLRSHSSLDASGQQIDFGSVKGKVGDGIVLETQVPPMLIFCAAQQVEDNCTSTNDTYFANMGELGPTSTLSAQSQMAVGTNATAGFVITANGVTMSAGTTTINPIDSPAESTIGKNQFGINLVANDSPAVGGDPEGVWANAAPTADYGQTNFYKFTSGDVIASSPNVSLMKKFTVSYIVNASPSLKAGVYTTTINYIASGRF